MRQIAPSPGSAERHHRRLAAAGLLTGKPAEAIPLPMRLGPRWLFLPLLFAIVFFTSLSFPLPAVGAESGQEAASALPTLTTAAAVHGLTHAQAKLGYPVHLRAICVVCFADWHGFWVNDGVSGVYVETKDKAPLTAAIHPGAVLDIEGVTGPGEFKPIVNQATMRIVGEAPLPPARDAKLDDFAAGAYDGQWFALEGTVRSAVLRDGMVSLIVISGRWQINAMTAPAPKEEFETLIGARVRIRATGGALINKRRQPVFLVAYAPRIDTIEVLKPALRDPFSLPLTPIMRVFDFAPGTTPDDPIRIRGVVTGRWGLSVFIHDGVQGASIMSAEPTSLKPGELVDAVGYPSLTGSTHTLDDAAFKRLGTAPPSEPKLVTAKEASSGEFVDEVIRMDGHMIRVQDEADQATLLIANGNTVFTAILPAEFKDKALAGLSDGSEIRLTGVCVISENQSARDFWTPKAFQILLRSPSDIVVLQRPTWWTPGHALVALAMAMAGTMLVLGWVVALRRRVTQQTSLLRTQADLLRESEERFRFMAQHDALTGLANRPMLQDRLDVALEAAKRRRSGLTLMMLDLDKFKQINDGLGHHAGDEVLRITANRLVEIFRKSDTVARLGGDEFVALLPELSDPIVAEILAAKVVAALALPISFAGRELQISASVGVCIAAPDELDAHALMKTADEALYRAKARGRNCFEFQATGLVATQEPESSLARASDLVRRLTSEEDCPPVDPQSVGFAEQSGHASSKRA